MDLYLIDYYYTASRYTYSYKSSTQNRNYTNFAMYWLLLLLPFASAANSFISRHQSLLPDLRIVNGDVIDISEAPYQASLQHPQKGHFCSASILSTRFLLTAAHFLNLEERQLTKYLFLNHTH